VTKTAGAELELTEAQMLMDQATKEKLEAKAELAKMIDAFNGNDFTDFKYRLDPELEQQIMRKTEASVIQQHRIDFNETAG